MPKGDEGRAGPTSYLVMVQDSLVAQDIADSVKECDPAAEVLLARRCGEALSMIEPLDALRAAVVELDPRQAAASVLEAALRARGTALVLFGSAAEDALHAAGAAGLEWPVLRRPFTARMVCDLLGMVRGA